MNQKADKTNLYIPGNLIHFGRGDESSDARSRRAPPAAAGFCAGRREKNENRMGGFKRIREKTREKQSVYHGKLKI
jgi:hypothetical protein